MGISTASSSKAPEEDESNLLFRAEAAVESIAAAEAMDASETRVCAALERGNRVEQANALYRALFEHPTQYIVVLEAVRDDDGVVKDWIYRDLNKTALALFPVSRERLLGSTLTDVLPDRADRLIRLCAKVLETRSPHSYEAQYGDVCMLLTIFPLDENTVASSGIDITERKRMEQALKETEERLREEDRRKDEFLAVLGHELRNPLAPLANSIELLAFSGSVAGIVEKVRPTMVRQLDYIKRLVDDLLDLSRISRGQVRLQFAVVDLHSAVDSAVEQCATLLDEHRHEFEVRRDTGPLSVRGDFQRLVEVLSNLLRNAAKYTEPGGRIMLYTEARESDALVRLVDNGIGIPPERLDKLFKMFSQVPEHSGFTGGGGLGIGLAVARQLVELHGGSIEARSQGLGRGSEFVVRLPLAAAV